MSGNVTMMGLEVFTELTVAGNVKLVVFENPNHAILYVSPALPAAMGASWKASPPFTLPLQAGRSYDLGFVADQAWRMYCDRTGETVGPISSGGTDNPLFGNYASPEMNGWTNLDCAVRFRFY